MHMKIHMEDNMKIYNTIISVLTLGTILWLIGIEDDDRRFKIVGACGVAVSIILNMLNNFNII